MSEQWLPVVGFEGIYEVSDHGNVRSLDRFIDNPLPTGVIRRQFIRGRTLRQQIARHSGYPYVDLKSGKLRRMTPIHRLVAEAFVGPKPGWADLVRHLNGNPDDNRAENLAYGTYSDNMSDSIRHGTHKYAGRSACSSGHEYTDANTYRGPAGDKRICRTCMDKYRRDWELRNIKKAV